MKVLKQVNRNILSPLLMNLKADRIIRSLTANSILNIMYHGVTKTNTNYFSPRHISAQQFESQLKYFSREFNVISISEAFDYKKNNFKPKRKTITISFDDGYKNNLYTALPLLEKYNMKATFFISGICTEELDIRALWTDIISCLRFFNQNRVIDLGNKRFINFIEVESKISLGDYLSSCGITELSDNLKYLIEKFNVEKDINKLPEEIWKLLDKNDLKELSNSRIVEIGSHGYSHYKLSNIDISDARKDLVLSKRSLQEAITREINMVAYPFGSYNKLIKDIAEQVGYNHQIAVDYMDPDDVNDLRILNRHGVPSTTTFDVNILLLSNAFRGKGYN